VTQAEKYCPTCRATYLFEELPSKHWKCQRCYELYHPVDLYEAFVNLRKDPEYKEKGISMSTEHKYKSGWDQHNKDLIQLGKDKAAMEVNKRLTLPIDSQERKSYPLLSGCLKYFGAALASVARTSKLGNDKHNPGQPLHHARGKSMDHGDCIIRHLMDIEDLLAARERGVSGITDRQILDEAGSLAWRALAYSQELHERLGAAPLAPGAKV